MAEKGGGGSVGKLWRRHGRGFYALVAVGTFLYLEATSLFGSAAEAESVRGFVTRELSTFMVESVLNTISASLWPWTWFRRGGWTAFYWIGGGYLIWSLLIAVALSRREKALRSELGL